MEYRIIDKTSYKLHFIKTDRFRTITVRVSLKDELKKEDITSRNILSDLLGYTTKEYNTRKKMVEAMQDLYSARIYSRDFRIGNYNTINLYITMLNEKYTEKGMIEKSIKLLGDCLFDQNINNKKFDSDIFKFIKKTAEFNIKTIKENPARYSTIRMLEEMSDENYSYREYGYLEDLENITEESIYEYYKRIINNSIVDIYVIGNFNDNEMEQYFDNYMKFETLKRDKKNIIIEHKNYRKRVKALNEKSENNQAKLTIGCKLIDLTERERNYVSTLYNIILGTSPESKFFKNIREKYSLCYYITSSLNKMDNLLLIRSGINNKNYDKIIKLIKKEMKDMSDGKISDDELENAKNIYNTRLNEILDNQDAIIETYIAVDEFNLGTIDERREEIRSVTKKEIVSFAKKIKMDTIFLLEGTDNAEDGA